MTIRIRSNRAKKAVVVATIYTRSIQDIALHKYRIPRGWYAVYDDLVGKLWSVRCESRGDLLIRGPEYENGSVFFMRSRDDRAVDGTLRKAHIKMQGTCELCGRAARKRQLGVSSKIMCATCFGVRKLEHELKWFLAKLKSGNHGTRKVWGTNDLSPRLRALFPAHLWQSISVQPDHRDEKCLAIDDIKAMVPMLEAINGRLLEISQDD